MNRKWNFALVLAAFLALNCTNLLIQDAKADRFTVGQDQFTVNVPKGWTVSRDFFGFPVAMLGPDNDEGHRTVVGITPAGGADTEKVFEKGDKDVSSYAEGRKRWLGKLDGTASSFDPYEKTTWKGVEEAHTLGYHYELPTGKYYERSLFVLCNGRRVIHMKSLVYSKYENSDNTLVDQTVKSLKCEKVELKSASL